MAWEEAPDEVRQLVEIHRFGEEESVMDEVFAILLAVGAITIGLLVIGWSYGDFHRPRS